MTHETERSLARRSTLFVLTLIVAGLTGCTKGEAPDSRPQVIGPTNAALLAPALVLREGGHVAWTGDGEAFAIASEPGFGPEISVYAYRNGALERVRILPQEVNAASLASSPDGKLLAVGGTDGVVRLWDVDSGELRHSLSGSAGTVFGLAFHPEGRMLASRDAAAVRVWDTSTWELVQESELAGYEPFGALAFSPDGRWLGVVHYSAQFPDGRLDLVAADGSDTPTISHSEQGGFLANFAFHPKENRLATIGLDRNTGSNVARLWRVEGGQLASVREIGGLGADSLAFSPDGRLIATGDSSGEGIQLWDSETGRLLHTVPDWFDARSEPVVFSPDGRWMARAGGHSPYVSIYEIGRALSEPRTLSVQTPRLVGSDVFQVESNLAALGYLAGEVSDGIFDEDTAAALRSFQTANQLESNGVADAATTARLADAYSEAVAMVPMPAASAPVLDAPTAAPTTPTLAPATPTTGPLPTFALPVLTSLPSEQDVAAIASIWDWYNLSDELDLPAPGSRQFPITLTPGKTFIWPFSWCASDESTLRDNLNAIAVDFQINLADVSPEDILQFERVVPGWHCHYWATTLKEWQAGSQASLAVLYYFFRDVNDGVQTYPAGDYSFVLDVVIGGQP